MASSWGLSWGTAWANAWGDIGAEEPVAAEEVFSGGFLGKDSKGKKTPYQLAMEGLARMEYVKPKMRKKGVIEPTNVPETAITDDTDEDDIKAIMLLIH